MLGKDLTEVITENKRYAKVAEEIGLKGELKRYRFLLYNDI